MNLYHHPSKINYKQISFYLPIPNKFSSYKKFYKLQYNTHIFIIHTLYILLDAETTIIKEDDKLFKYTFTYREEQLRSIEDNILGSLKKHVKKEIVYNHPNTTLIRHHAAYVKKPRVYLRVSGVWENDHSIGITCKIECYPST